LHHSLYQQLQQIRHGAGLTFAALASAINRPAPRISEFMNSLAQATPHRDRMTTFIDMCEALSVVPVLVPRERLNEIEHLIGRVTVVRSSGAPVQDVYDETFIDLSKAER
jgi:hypothetical protein